MPATLEKIVVNAQARAAEHFRPDLSHGFFNKIARCGKFFAGFETQLVGRRQRVAVHLAVGRQRPGIQEGKRRRHHVIGKFRPQKIRQLFDRGRGALIGNQIGRQLLLSASAFARQHQAFPHRRMLVEQRLDLARLNPITANLDLLIDPTEKFEIAVGLPADQVAGFVEARAGPFAQGMRNEFFRREDGIVSIAARQAVAANVKFARHTDRHGSQKPVEHVSLHVGNRTANWRSAVRYVMGGRDRSTGRDHGVFRRSIVIDQTKRQLRSRTAMQFVAAGEQHSQGSVTGPGHSQRFLGDGRWHKADGDFPGAQPFHQAGR